MISSPVLFNDLQREWIKSQLAEQTPPFFVQDREHRLFAISKTICWYIFSFKEKSNIVGEGSQTIHTFAKEYFSGEVAVHGWTLLKRKVKLDFSESEIECLELVKGESGIIQNLGHYYHRTEKGFLFRGMITEYYPRKHIDVAFFEGSKRELAKKIIEIVARIHKKGVIHRDIKLGNILLDKFDNPVIADFGFACKTNSSLITCFAGTPSYFCPEHIKHLSSDAYIASIKDDVWATAVVVYKIIFRANPPYLTIDGCSDIGIDKLKADKTLSEKMLNGMREFSKGIEPKSDIIEKLKKMFAYLPIDRPGLFELLPIDYQKEEVKPLDKPKQIVIIQSGIAFYSDGRMKPVFF